MDVAKSKSSNVAIEMVEGGIRELVRGNRPSDAVVSSAEDSLAAGATSIADIEQLMEELRIARDYLQSEGERMRQANARYAHLAQTASASVKTIAESMGKWRKLEASGLARAALPRAPNLAPIHDGELQQELNDQ